MTLGPLLPSLVMVPANPSVQYTVPRRTATWNGASTVEFSLRAPDGSDAAEAGALAGAPMARAAVRVAMVVVRVLRCRLMGPPGCEHASGLPRRGPAALPGHRRPRDATHVATIRSVLVP